ncbi:DUF6114 domain-containing protein [Cryptosporangium aurantiacum]|uniref:DUF6114 domain-containing protein n=1 Tax=Cryptosporangium aurantiacum TaxID=134849 RepID=UPI000934C85C|nr:DUF6114 domain-containing protein [Cryptosporangium aurantiacum]
MLPFPDARHWFRRWRRTRPFWAGCAVIAGGTIMLSVPLAPLPVMMHVGTAAVSGVAFGLILIAAGLFFWFAPQQRTFVAVVSVIVSLASFVTTNLGGLGFGMLLGLVGSSMAFGWRPHSAVAAGRHAGRRPAAPDPDEDATDVLDPVDLLDNDPGDDDRRAADPDAEAPTAEIPLGTGERGTGEPGDDRAPAVGRAAPVSPAAEPPPGRGHGPGLTALVLVVALVLAGAVQAGAAAPAAAAAPRDPTAECPDDSPDLIDLILPWLPRPADPCPEPSTTPTPAPSAGTPGGTTPSPGTTPGATPTPTPTPSASGTAPPAAGDGTGPGYPVAPNVSQVSADTLEATGFTFRGATTLPTATGPIKVLVFHADRLVAAAYRIRTADPGPVLNLGVNLDISDVEIYATGLSGTVTVPYLDIPLLPISITAAIIPTWLKLNLTLPLFSGRDVTAGQVLIRAGTVRSTELDVTVAPEGQ